MNSDSERNVPDWVNENARESCSYTSHELIFDFKKVIIEIYPQLIYWVRGSLFSLN